MKKSYFAMAVLAASLSSVAVAQDSSIGPQDGSREFALSGAGTSDNPWLVEFISDLAAQDFLLLTSSDASMQIGENPGTAYNPLFIYGGVGLGKTHISRSMFQVRRE